LKFENNAVSKRVLIKSSLIQKILKEYSLNPEEVIFIGNADEDIKSGSKTGVNFIFFKNAYLPHLPKLNLRNVNMANNMDDLKKEIEKVIIKDDKMINEE